MIYAIDNRRARRRTTARIEVRPFRLLAGVLMLVLFAMFFGILNTPTYEQERLEAEMRYNQARDLNAQLRKEINIAESREALETSARKELGYTYNGEIIYKPLFVDGNGNAIEAP